MNIKMQPGVLSIRKKSPAKFTSPRAMVFRRSDEELIAELAEQLGVKLAGLNTDQRRLLKTMGERPMTRKARLDMLADAAD